MAFDKTPTTHIAGWSEDGTNVTFPISSFAQLDATEADAATGDIRRIAFALAEKLFAIYAAMATADRPVNFAVRRSTSDGASGNLNRSYSIDFTIEATALEVIPEA